MAKLTIHGPQGPIEHELKALNSLGRHPDNSIQVLDRVVSKEHCRIEIVDGQYVAIDLGSLNGTLVNGERIPERQVLLDGDELTLGSTRIIFQDQAQQPVIKRKNSRSKVTIAPGSVESNIRTRLTGITEHNFMPEALVPDDATVRQDYEKLRVSYELARAIGAELNVDKLLEKIIDTAFQLLPADRGVVLLYDESKELQPRCARTKGTSTSTEELLISTTILNEVIKNRAAVLSHDARLDERFQGAHSVIMQGIRSSMAVPLIYSDELFGVMLLDSKIATHAFTEKDLKIFQNIGNQAAIAIQNGLYARKIEQEALTRERFQRLLSPAIAEQVMSGDVEVEKGGELRDTTVLFSDIRGFTSMSESREPQQIVNMLNEYFERMVELIFKYEGTLDKFVGDEIMALYGSPVALEDNAVRAVATAIDMMDELRDLNFVREQRGEIPLQIGIGINSGEVIAGYLGSSKALEYTVIGDVVNTGARLCSLAKAGEVLISEQTYARVKDHFDLEERPQAQVKGKAQALRVFQVLGRKADSFGGDFTARRSRVGSLPDAKPEN